MNGLLHDVAGSEDVSDGTCWRGVCGGCLVADEESYGTSERASADPRI